jgi:hypothetical protein
LDCPEDTRSTSNIARASIPALQPSTIASATSACVTPVSTWLHRFTVVPTPTGPRWNSLSPTISRTGRAAASASDEALIMMLSVPAAAPAGPPLTGASCPSARTG